MVDADPEDTFILLKLSLASFTDAGVEEEVFPLPVLLIDERESCRDCELIELRESPELILWLSAMAGRPAVSGGTMFTTYCRN